MPNKFELRTTNPVFTEHLDRLIEQNRDKLIQASIADVEIQKKMLEINKLINEVKLKDPNTVAAWGLACGGGCAVQPEVADLITTLAGRR